MAGTKEGAAKAARTIKARHGNDFYVTIGKKGGSNGHTGGFAANPKLARIAGRKGGRISRRGKKITVTDLSEETIVTPKVDHRSESFFARLFGKA